MRNLNCIKLNNYNYGNVTISCHNIYPTTFLLHEMKLITIITTIHILNESRRYMSVTIFH